MGRSSTRSWLAFVLSALLMLTSVPQALAATSSPLQQDEGVALLREYNIVRGDNTGNLHLDSKISRAELAAIVVRAMGADDMATRMSGSSVFTDMAGYEWANGYVAMASQMGLVKGRGNGLFDPGSSVTYAEAYTILLRMVQREPVGAWNPTQIVNTAKMTGIAPAAVTDANANQAAIRGPVFGSLANAVAYVQLPDGTTILRKYVDSLPPVISLSQVPASTMEDSVTISGTADGATSVTVNGKSVPLTGKQFSTTVDLELGNNTINVVATDRAGNTANKVVTVSYSVSASKITVTGNSQLKTGESTTILATAFDSSNRPISSQFMTASVTGGIGTYDLASGKFTAGSKAGTGSIVFKSGNVTETFEVTVIDANNVAAGLRIRYGEEDQTYLIDGQDAVILVEVIDKEGNVVKYDKGREVTLESDDNDLEVADTEATTVEGIAIFRVEASGDGEFELEASSKGLDTVTLPVFVAPDEDHIVLIPEVSYAPADGDTEVKIRAYLRDEDGDDFDNESNADLDLELSIDADEAELDDDVITIDEDDDASNTAVVVAGDEPETVIIEAELDPDIAEGDEADYDEDYDDLYIVPAVITFVNYGVAADDDEDEDEDSDSEWEGEFQLDVDDTSLDIGDEADIVVEAVDEDGDELDGDDYAFEVEVEIDGWLLDTNGDRDEEIEWDSGSDDWEDLPADFSLVLGSTSYTPVQDSEDADAVIARTSGGSAQLYLTFDDFEGEVTITIVGVRATDEAYDDDGDPDDAESGRYLKSASETIEFQD